MIFLTVISEEKVVCKQHGRWYDDDEEWNKEIQRHIFIYNPNKEPLLIRLGGRAGDFSYVKKLKSMDIFLKTTELETSDNSLLNEELTYKSAQGYRSTIYTCQYVDSSNTRKLCSLLNQYLGFSHYFSCEQINPCSLSPIESYTINGKHYERRHAFFLPNPFCRIFGYGVKKMKEINAKNFQVISKQDMEVNNLHGTKQLLQEYSLLQVKSYKQVRAELVDKYRKGEIVPDADEEDWYNDMDEEQRFEEEMLERGLSYDEKYDL